MADRSILCISLDFKVSCDWKMEDDSWMLVDLIVDYELMDDGKAEAMAHKIAP